MRTRWLALAILAAIPFVSACDSLGDIDPVETACALCQMLDETGICQMVQEKAAECAVGEQLVLLNLEEVVDSINAGRTGAVVLKTGCR